MPSFATKQQLQTEFNKFKPMLDHALQHAENNTFVTQTAFANQVTKVNHLIEELKQTDDKFGERIYNSERSIHQHAETLLDCLHKSALAKIEKQVELIPTTEQFV